MASAEVEAATALKVKGNKAFAEHNWPGAIDFYTQAIEKYDKDPSFWCNRAQVGLRRRWARDQLLSRTGEYQA
jgi:serine/threonine-protein phosphatase 5